MLAIISSPNLPKGHSGTELKPALWQAWLRLRPCRPRRYRQMLNHCGLDADQFRSVNPPSLNGDLDDDRTSFTTHLEGGFSFASNRHLQLGLAYRWTWFENDLDGLEDAASSHQVRLGARFFY